jgi:hypothetical protein
VIRSLGTGLHESHAGRCQAFAQDLEVANIGRYLEGLRHDVATRFRGDFPSRGRGVLARSLNPHQANHLADICHLLEIPEAIQQGVDLP